MRCFSKRVKICSTFVIYETRVRDPTGELLANRGIGGDVKIFTKPCHYGVKRDLHSEVLSKRVKICSEFVIFKTRVRDPTGELRVMFGIGPTTLAIVSHHGSSWADAWERVGRRAVTCPGKRCLIREAQSLTLRAVWLKKPQFSPSGMRLL
ncbi:hypothetical protein CEXT_199541 [Caerostris extrusa]|uniref:Uncharacterized protein n=1 Tax=Caerostris extrusa TaxID=172846 RepID=A0AAV4R896_CAEEX|nr:hypothetical protein CEXT_199541 [Caerostris extrusa]